MKLRDSLAENKSIRLQAEAETWQDAVKIGVDLLVAADVVEPRYYQAILDAVEQHGPYFVLAPGLAMPHGRPEEGVKKTGFALVTLKKPLEFNHEDNDPVDILITMAAVDANTHQEVGIMQIVNLFEDEENFDRLRACRTEQEVLDLIEDVITHVASRAGQPDYGQRLRNHSPDCRRSRHYRSGHHSVCGRRRACGS